MSHKSQIHYLPDDCTIEISDAQSILEASLAAGVPIAHACGGQARCSTCRVMVLEGMEHCSARSPEEEKLSHHLGFGCSVRLACQTRVHGPVRLRRLILDWEDELFEVVRLLA
jgi:adenylate cyclase